MTACIRKPWKDIFESGIHVDFNTHSCIYSLGNSKTFVSSVDFVFKINLFKNSIRDTIRVANGLYPDED